VRKAQLMNYDAFRAMYEGRNAQLFHPTTAVITWMSDPAQPSFVWQIYHYDLEPNSSLFAVRSAAEMQHIQFNQADGGLQVINNLPEPLEKATAHMAIYNLDGSIAAQKDIPVTAPPATAANLGPVDFPAGTSTVRFLKLDLKNAAGKLLSTNFYWLGPTLDSDDLTDLNKLPQVTLEAHVARHDLAGKTHIAVTLRNPSKDVALMVHLQLHRAKSGERVLPVFYDGNYVSLVPGESRTIAMEADLKDLKGEPAQVQVDGWNVTMAPATAPGVSIAPNVDADPNHWPVTGLPFQTVGLR
jgi:hypothetical protein